MWLNEELLYLQNWDTFWSFDAPRKCSIDASKILSFVGMVDNTRVNMRVFGVKRLVIDKDAHVNNLES